MKRKDTAPVVAGLNFSDPKIVETIRLAIAPDATQAELAFFVEACKATQLNPFKKEIWFIKAGGRVQIMTGINGFFTLANRHPQFDGMQVDTDNDDNPSKAIARVYRKDRQFPSVGVAMMREFKKDTPTWRAMPRHMLTKCAKAIALREAFPQECGMLYLPEEFGVDEAPVEPKAANVVSVKPVKKAEIAAPLAEEKKPLSWTYNVATVPEEKMTAALMLLERAKAECIGEGVYTSPVEVVKLAAYQVKEGGENASQS